MKKDISLWIGGSLVVVGFVFLISVFGVILWQQFGLLVTGILLAIVLIVVGIAILSE
jgi:hypothetical protein